MKLSSMNRARAVAKADAVVEHIGYPSELLSAQKLEDLYAGLELNATHYLVHNLFRLRFFIYKTFSNWI